MYKIPFTEWVATTSYPDDLEADLIYTNTAREEEIIAINVMIKILEKFPESLDKQNNINVLKRILNKL